MDHDCYFDHHGMYDCTLHVPLIMRHPKLPRGRRCGAYTLHQDLVPTLLELLEIEPDVRFDGKSLLPLISGERANNWPEFYITECIWMGSVGSWKAPY